MSCSFFPSACTKQDEFVSEHSFTDFVASVWKPLSFFFAKAGAALLVVVGFVHQLLGLLVPPEEWETLFYSVEYCEYITVISRVQWLNGRWIKVDGFVVRVTIDGHEVLHEGGDVMKGNPYKATFLLPEMVDWEWHTKKVKSLSTSSIRGVSERFCFPLNPTDLNEIQITVLHNNHHDERAKKAVNHFSSGMDMAMMVHGRRSN